MAENITIRPAILKDAPQIADVKTAVWPDEKTNVWYIQQVLKNKQHKTHVAESDGKIVGFVDGFVTRTAQRKKRWEVDLLATHPDYRGRGIATKLVKVSTEAGQAAGAKTARGLVQVSNIPSQRAFARCNYYISTETYGLYVSSKEGTIFRVDDIKDVLIQVETMNYRGIWLEGELSPQTFASALTARQQLGVDIAGAVISLENEPLINGARDAGYEFVSNFQWWTLDLNKARHLK